MKTLESLCGEMEATARRCGGITIHAEQSEWGIEAREREDEPGVYDLRDCDGECWASGTPEEILASRTRLLAEVQRIADESNIEA